LKEENELTSPTKLSAGMEDYLEAIYHIVSEKQAARTRDISKRLKVKMSSVTGALRSLAEKKLINYAPYEIITLTPRGKTLARGVVRRHETLRNFFTKILLVDYKIADEGACKMEHVIPSQILKRLTEFAEFIESCPRAGVEWLQEFRYRCEHGKATRKKCERCLDQCLEQYRQRLESS
jgi:DtxR family Mn-dependent transcriptional regulator